MSYSRSRTYEKKRSRRRGRFRYLATLNVVMLGLIAAVAAVWFLAARDSGGFAPSDAGSTDGSKSAASPRDAAATSSPRSSLSLPAETSSDAGAEPAGSESLSAGRESTGSESASAGADPASKDTPSASADAGEPNRSPGASGEGTAGNGQISMAFVGDILPASSVARLLEKNGYDYPYRAVSGLLQSADIAAGNLESAITDRGTPEKNKQYLYRGSALALPAIREAGFDVLSLANNHTLDYGWVGLQDTMDALDDNQIHHMGSGNDDQEAFTPAYVEAQGITVAFIGVSHVVPNVSWKADRNHPGVAETYNPTRAIAAIREAKNNADIVVVMVHWGDEYTDKPIAEQTNNGRKFIDAGADLVIGSHPHVLQGFEAYKGKWIAYSLGNFVFSATKSPKSAETGVLIAECGKDGSCALTLHPMLAQNAQPAPMDEQAGKALLARLSAVSTAAEVEENGQIVAKR
ncbi:CapA family protein [Cohnella sp. CFH 77786]|uniref:CapA family protein n=1 Tax=Cohnella sp. CFH 77786 TaxID=2662265 RepID=UPI001C60A485|nr:CapA family protein [Cohnella sp. CFH 77786]MBW5445015.1 CapA family protein [Cohnella sp. CFH 77786]